MSEDRTRTRAVIISGLCALFLSGAVLLAEAPPGGWEKTEAALKNAVLQDDAKAGREAIQALALTRERRGYRAILKYALEGRSYPIYSYAAGALVQVEDPGIREDVYSRLERDPNYKTRIILLAVVKRWAKDDSKAVEALHGRLRDPRKPVVLAALRWIRELNRPEVSMEPLIAELERREKHEKGRVYHDIRKTLEGLTGHRFAVAADWKNYWEVRKENPNAGPRKGEGRTVLASGARFFSIGVDSTRVVFVIDVSGSMAKEDLVTTQEDIDRVSSEEEEEGRTVVRVKRDPSGESGRTAGRPGPVTYSRSRLSAVQEELIRTIQSLSSSVHFNIIAFNHEVHHFDRNPGLMQATSSNKQRAVQWVSRLTPGGATRTDLALRAALQLVDADTIYVLTDGAPKTVDNRDIPAEYVFQAVDEENRFLKTRIHTIGIKQSGRSMQRFVRELAKRNDGRCVLIE